MGVPIANHAETGSAKQSHRWGWRSNFGAPSTLLPIQPLSTFASGMSVAVRKNIENQEKVSVIERRLKLLTKRNLGEFRNDCSRVVPREYFSTVAARQVAHAGAEAARELCRLRCLPAVADSAVGGGDV